LGLTVLNEDQRSAAGLAVGLSGQVSAAALTMLTVLGAFVLLVLDKREANWWFVIVTIVTFALFLTVAVIGGRATRDLYYAVAAGNWQPSTSKSAFNVQAISGLLALIAFALSIAVSFELPEKSDAVAVSPRTIEPAPAWGDTTAAIRAAVAALSVRLDSIETALRATQRNPQPKSNQP
jgi:hypothetical protein